MTNLEYMKSINRYDCIGIILLSSFFLSIYVGETIQYDGPPRYDIAFIIVAMMMFGIWFLHLGDKRRKIDKNQKEKSIKP